MTFTPVAEQFQFLDARLVITRGGAPGTDRPLTVPNCDPPFCKPVGVHVRDLDADGEPEVLVDGHTMGAHCCLLTQLFTWNRTQYDDTSHGWLDASYEIRDLNADGRPELESVDARFRYAFASFAGSAFPLQVWQVDGGAFEDVTAGFPEAIQRDAARWLRIWRGRRGDREREPDGVLAAWAADMELLGRRAAVKRQLRSAVRRRWTTRRFVRELDRFLRGTGYRR